MGRAHQRTEHLKRPVAIYVHLLDGLDERILYLRVEINSDIVLDQQGEHIGQTLVRHQRVGSIDPVYECQKTVHAEALAHVLRQATGSHQCHGRLVFILERTAKPIVVLLTDLHTIGEVMHHGLHVPRIETVHVR